MGGLGSLGGLDKSTEASNDRLAIWALESLKSDSSQIGKLQSWIARPNIAVGDSITVRTSTHHDAHHVIETLRHNLRTHRLRAIVVRNHDRHAVPSSPKRGGAAPVAMAAAPAAGSPHALAAVAGGPAPVSSGSGVLAHGGLVSIASWSTEQRLETLLEDALPVLGKGLR